MKFKLMQKLTMAAIGTFLLIPVYGTVTGPGTISSLSANALDRSGYLEVLGSNFGGSGEVLIDGISARVTRWESTRIVAYVPEGACGAEELAVAIGQIEGHAVEVTAPDHEDTFVIVEPPMSVGVRSPSAVAGDRFEATASQVAA